ncbi:MAG: LL-diaminopimelate aminotransferase [Acholeplasmatales bacterium]|nr:LL-diaminopimelate aminotransferase [Acholeplasmatales bacterium]
MKIKINENFNNLSKNYLFSEINIRVKKYIENNPDKNIIRLGIGDVTLPLPKIVVDAIKKAADEMANQKTFRGYPPEYGYEFLKDSVRNYYGRKNIKINNEDIFISDGAKSDLGNIVDIFADNEIYIPNPVYPVYLDSNVMSGRNINYIEGNKENNFLPMPNGLDNNPKIIYLCSPNNPTGSLYNYDELKKWVDYAIKTESLIIYDNAYEAFIDGKYPHSIFEIEGAKTCAIEVSSLSKMAGFTGVRCGFTIIPTQLKSGDTKINDLWKRRQATKFNGVSYPVQRAAEAALSIDGEKECLKNINYYKNNAKLLADFFKSKGIYYTGGNNSPYIWLKCKEGYNSWEFFDYILNNASIVTTPGSGFGVFGEGYLRITAFNTLENTKLAIERLNKIL